MTPEAHILSFHKVGATETEGSEQQRTSFKDLAWRHIDTITESQSRILLKDIRTLERFLLTVEYPRELHQDSRDNAKHPHYNTAYNNAYKKTRASFKKKNDLEKGSYYKNSLKQVVGGLINVMPLARLQEISNNPTEFTNFLNGEPFIVPEIQKKPEAVETLDEDSGEKEVNPILDLINEIALEKWVDFPWEKPGELLVNVREYFKSLRPSHLDVKVEFFRPNDKEHSKDYIVISENKPAKAKGIIMIRPGLTLNVPMTFDFFGGSKPGRKVSVSNLLAFPQVQSTFKSATSQESYWRITKHGKLADE